MTPSAKLDKFGMLVVEQLWNRPIAQHDLLAEGHWKAPELRELQTRLAGLSGEQREIVRRCVIEALSGGLHGLLAALQEAHDLEQGIEVLVDGASVAEVSDGLQGELYGENGWLAKYGTPDQGSYPELE